MEPIEEKIEFFIDTIVFIVVFKREYNSNGLIKSKVEKKLNEVWSKEGPYYKKKHKFVDLKSKNESHDESIFRKLA